MFDNLFIVGRTTLFMPVDINLQQVVDFLNFSTRVAYFIFTTITFLTVLILTHPVNFPCGRKLEHPEKTYDFQQSVDRLFSHESVARIEPTISEVKGAGADH
jgi:hypothetical protein